MLKHEIVRQKFDKNKFDKTPTVTQHILISNLRVEN